MALNETSLRDVIMMEVARVNEAGGVLGRPIEPVALDPASDWAAYRDLAHILTQAHHVAAIFGCWTSASRKMVIPLIEREDTLLFYPLQYEGEEQSPNVFYLGASPNQQAIPALEYLMSAAGGAFSRFFLLELTTSIRAPPTAFCAPSLKPRAFRWPIAQSSTSRSATATGAPKSKRCNASGQAGEAPSSPPSMAILI